MARILPFILSFLSFLPLAQGQFNFGGGKTSSKAELVSEAGVIAAGHPFTVALRLDHPAGWHSYYRNSGGVELPPAIRWHLPEGFTAGPIQWPVPTVKDGLDGKSFIYPGSVFFLMEITPPAVLPEGGTVSLTADATWQICKESCINESKSLTLKLPVGRELQLNPASAEVFNEARSKLPHAAEGWTVTAQSQGSGDVVVRIATPGNTNVVLEKIDFIPNEPFLQSLSSGGAARKEGNDLILTLKRRFTNLLDQKIPQENEFSGILLAGTAIDLPKTSIVQTTAPAPPLQTGYVLKILLSMFAGGIILNLMPCVFPVIGLKIMGFVQQSGQDRKKIVLHGVLFAVGVLLSFAVLSGILFAARAAAATGGQQIGWGYQLQIPWVVLSLTILMFLLALSMYGVFEIGTSATSIGGSLQSKQGLSGSLFSGILATVVATPCSAPLLGAAIGAAVAFPAPLFFLSFAMMGLGLSLPYLILSIFPKLVDYLPRPGPWMESFKQGLSFLLFATTAVLFFIYANQIGSDVYNMAGPIMGLTAIGIAAWIYGRWNVPYRSPKTRKIALILAILFVIGGVFLAKPPKPSALVWEKWSEERVQQLTAEGKPVYVDFTAQWCFTCLTNKKTAYNQEVIDLIHKKGIVLLKADKTNPDPKIEAKLQELGRTAIPVNLLIVPGKAPVITPEVLTSSYLKELFEKQVP